MKKNKLIVFLNKLFFLSGVNNAVNFFFCLYLFCKYKEDYKEKNEDGVEEKNVLQRTVNLILYDFVVCIYTFILITFFIVWTIIGLNISNNEPKNSACYTNNGGFVIIAHNINLIVMIVFLTVGFLAFVITVIITACDEGS